MKYMTKRLTLAAAITFAMASLGASLAHAEDAPAAKPDNEVSFNAALTTDYRYRGYSQTRLKPAVQGGADYTHNPSGFYAGTWLSTIKWVKDAGGDASVEWDIYGGKRGDIGGGFSYDVGGLYYFYPSNDLHPSANTFELYGAVGYGPFSLKYSHSTTNLFGFTDSKNSGYVDAAMNQEIQDGYILNLHLGHQKVNHNSVASYYDWKIGVTKDFGVATVSLAAIKANTDAYYSRGKNLAKTGAVLTVTKTF
ncbi:TorF family putative porin [Pseudoduganella sp. LjRoot289]|uniref:TorF family putative porin n=1 Tax=Pseudoduganella sp. LjRoot289 TaxID=3342314 RepID=UPI003ED0FC08